MARAEAVRAKAGETLLLSECYASIQGESTLVGTPTVFVRLYTCNLRCVWCDSMHAVEGGEFREVSVGALVDEVNGIAGGGESPRSGISHVCWTGGEPLLQWKSVARAIEALPPHFVHSIETDGEIDIAPFDLSVRPRREAALVRYVMDVKCPGSGMTAKRAFENLGLLRGIDEVKFVLLDRADYDFAQRVLAEHRMPTPHVLFSPVFPAHKVKGGLDPAALASWILEDRLDVRLQPQVHKYIWPGKERGV